jgi:hypothetical protein
MKNRKKCDRIFSRRINQLTVGLSPVIALLVIASTSGMYAAGFTVANQTNLSNDSYQSTDPNVQNSGNNVFVAWTTDSGKTWSTPSAIGISDHDNSWPVNVAVSGSTAFILWYEKTTTTSTGPWQALISVSTNSGTSWSSPTTLGGSIAESDIATASVASSGTTAFAVWTNTAAAGNTQVYFASGS